MKNQLVFHLFFLFCLPFVIEFFHDRTRDDLAQHPPFIDNGHLSPVGCGINPRTVVVGFSHILLALNTTKLLTDY